VQLPSVHWCRRTCHAMLSMPGGPTWTPMHFGDPHNHNHSTSSSANPCGILLRKCLCSCLVMIHQTVAQAVFTRYGRAMATAASIQLLPLHNLRMLTSALRLRMGSLARLSLEHFCDVCSFLHPNANWAILESVPCRHCALTWNSVCMGLDSLVLFPQRISRVPVSMPLISVMDNDVITLLADCGHSTLC
jgi:hypothetical protein